MRYDIVMKSAPKRLQFEAAAYHEAGHAVIAWRHRQIVRERGVTIDPSGAGHTHVRSIVSPGEGTAVKANGDVRLWKAYCRQVAAQVEIVQAGWLAEHLHHGMGGLHTANDVENVIADVEWYGRAAQVEANEEIDDLEFAVDTLIEAYRTETGRYELTDADAKEITRTYLQIQRRLFGILRRPRTWGAIEAVAEGLLERYRLDMEEIYSVIEAARPPRAPIVALDSL